MIKYASCFRQVGKDNNAGKMILKKRNLKKCKHII